MANPFETTFSNSQVVEATGATTINIQNWIVRGWITGPHLPEGGGSQGKHRRYSFHNLMLIAAAKALSEAGLHRLEDVFHAAGQFAHFADMQSNPIRLPGLPFRQGLTLIIAGAGWSKVIAVRPDQSAFDLFADMSMTPTGAALGATWIDAGELFRQTMTRAGFDPEAVLRDAYGQ